MAVQIGSQRKHFQGKKNINTQVGVNPPCSYGSYLKAQYIRLIFQEFMQQVLTTVWPRTSKQWAVPMDFNAVCIQIRKHIVCDD